MKKHLMTQLAAAGLALTLVTAPSARALTLEQAAELLETFYVDDIPQSVLEQTSIPEMLKALGDPYTEYFTPKEYTAFNASMSDASLVGIGVVTTMTEEGLLISTVLENSPAEKGGIHPGDLIVAVDGQSIIGETPDDAVARIQGQEGTPVEVTYLREGQSETTTLIRALVVVPATTTELIDEHIGYIRCTTFGDETAQHFRDGIEKYDDQVSVWIVDLRSNTGGSTQAAVDAAGCFTGPGGKVYLRNGQNEYSTYYYEEKAMTIYPVIVLMDQYSASSSELFAAAIRDYGSGVVIGTRSFGKGVAQTVLDQRHMPEYFSEGDAIKITSHRFFTPSGNSTDQVGVIPNLLVEEDMIAPVALLLAGSYPLPWSADTLRIDMEWRWYIDLEQALETSPDALWALLDAMPASPKLFLGTEVHDNWEAVDAAEVAERYHLPSLTPTFPDLAESRFASAIGDLKTFDLLRGKEDGLFHPGDTLTRAELCQMLAEALNCMVPTNTSPYSDVPDKAWYAPAVIAMSNMGLVNGVGNGEFRPEDPVDHQQLITILSRLGQRLNLTLYDTILETPETDMDVIGVSEYADWAKSSAWLLSYSQKGYFGNTISLLWESADKIDPTSSSTREEAAYGLYRILAYTDILPV